MVSKSKSSVDSSEMPIFTLLQALDTSYPDFSSRLTAAASLVGLPAEWTSFDPRVVLASSSDTLYSSSTSDVPTKFTATYLNQGHSYREWLLRYLLEKLSSTQPVGAVARSNELTWTLLNSLVYMLPLSSVAKLLKGKGVCMILERSLDEILAYILEDRVDHSIINNSRKTRDVDSDGDDLMSNISHSSDSDSTTLNRKRKERTHPSKRSAPNSAPLPSHLLNLRGISVFLHTLASPYPSDNLSTKSTDSIPLSHLHSIIRCEADRASRIFGRWLSLMSECLGRFPNASWQPRLNTILPIWMERISRSGEAEDGSSVLFALECLVPVCRLLQYSPRSLRGTQSHLVSTISSPEHTTLENLVIKTLFFGAYRDFLSTQDNDSRLSIGGPTTFLQLRKLLHPLSSYYSKLLSSSSEKEDATSRQLESVVTIFQAIVLTSQVGSHQQRMTTQLWLQTVFIELLRCIGILYPSSVATSSTSISKGSLQCLQGMIDVLHRGHISLDPLVITNLVTQVCYIDTASHLTDSTVSLSSSNSSSSSTVHWALIAEFLRYSPMIFLPQVSQKPALDKFIIQSIMGFSSTEFSKTQLLEDVIIPWARAFLEARQFSKFVSLWFESLSSISITSSSILQADYVLSRLSSEAFSHVSASQDSLIKEYITIIDTCSVSSKDVGNTSTLQRRFHAAITILTCTLSGLSPRTLSTSSLAPVRSLVTRVLSSKSFSQFFSSQTLVPLSQLITQVFRLLHGFESSPEFTSFVGEILATPNFESFLSFIQIRKLYKDLNKGNSKQAKDGLNFCSSPIRIVSAIFEMNLSLASLLSRTVPSDHDISKRLSGNICSLADKLMSDGQKLAELLLALSIELLRYPEVFWFINQSSSSDASHSVMMAAVSACSVDDKTHSSSITSSLLHSFVKQVSYTLPDTIQTSLFKSLISSPSFSSFLFLQDAVSSVPSRAIPRRFRETVINQIQARIEQALEATPKSVFDGEQYYFSTLLGLLSAPSTTSVLFTEPGSLVKLALRLDKLNSSNAPASHVNQEKNLINDLATLSSWFALIVQAVFKQLEFLKSTDQESFGLRFQEELQSHVSSSIKKFLRKANKTESTEDRQLKQRKIPLGSLILSRELLVNTMTVPSSSVSNPNAAATTLLPAAKVIQNFGESSTIIQRVDQALSSSSLFSFVSLEAGHSLQTNSSLAITTEFEFESLITHISKTRSSARKRATALREIQDQLQTLATKDLNAVVQLLIVSMQRSLGIMMEKNRLSDFINQSDSLEASILIIKSLTSHIPNVTGASKVMSEAQISLLRELFVNASSQLSIPVHYSPDSGELDLARRHYHGQLSHLVQTVLSGSCVWIASQSAIDLLLRSLLHNSSPVYLASLDSSCPTQTSKKSKTSVDNVPSQTSAAGSVYGHTARLTRLVLLLHRSRLAGRFHLLLPILENLLSCMFYSPLIRSSSVIDVVGRTSSISSSSPASPASPALTVEHAALLNRLLITLASPTSTGSHHHSHGAGESQVLVDTTARARKHTSRYAQYLIMQFCRSTLGYASPFCATFDVSATVKSDAVPSPGDSATDSSNRTDIHRNGSIQSQSVGFLVPFQAPPTHIRSSFMPGVFSLLSLIEPGIKQAMVEEMGHQTGTVWIGLVKEWERECGNGSELN